MKNYLKILIPSTILLLTVIVVGTNLNKPFWGEHDWNGARYGNIAKNYLRYGLIETKLAQVENGGISKSSEFIFYTHYQPLLPLLIAGSYDIFGVSEFATRLVPLLATSGLALTLYLICSLLWGKGAGIFASLVSLSTPMVRYYGKNPVHEPLAAFFGALAFYGAVRIKNKKSGGWPILITGFILAALTNWSFVFLTIGLTIYLYEKKHVKGLMKIWLLGILLGLAHFAHAYFLTGSFFGGGLVGALLLRTSLDQSTTSFSIFGYLERIRLWSSTLFTNTLLITSALGLFLLVFKKNPKWMRLIIGTFIFAFYSIFFANASFIHSYFIYYFILPFSTLMGFLYFFATTKNKIWFAASLLILPLVFFERNQYVLALNSSSGDRAAVDAGKLIRVVTKPNDRILVMPSEYAESRLPILSYYSERNITTGTTADWVLTVDGDSYQVIRK